MENPLFTIVMPCLNEEANISRAVKSLVDDYVLRNGEILIVDGGSTDRTREIVSDLAGKYPIRLLENPNRLQSHGMNIGIREARGAIIIRADAHGLYPPDYVRRCVRMLEPEDIANAGGVMVPAGETPVQKAIARAMRHPLGVGDAKYHLGRYRGYYEGVYLGSFKKNIFDKVGLYDPKAHPKEDAEMNLRIIRAGGKIWLDGSLEVIYRPRKSYAGLFRQYFHYGRGRCYTTLKHRRFTSWRQVLPPVWVMALFGSAVLSFWTPLFLIFPGLYATAVLFAALFGKIDPRPSLKERFLIFPAFVSMHIAWGSGFLSKLPGGLAAGDREK